MKKTLITLSLALFSTSIFAQDLEKMIPNSAHAVIEFNIEHLFDLVPLSEIESTPFFEKLKEKENFSFSNSGIDLTSKAYYFFEIKENAQHHQVVFKLKDEKKL